MVAAIVAAALVVAAGGGLLYLAPRVAAVDASGVPVSTEAPVSRVSLPLFFEQNQGQTDAQVKFLARGSGYSLFLTADEAVLKLQRGASSRQPSAVSSQDNAPSVIRMRLEGANAAARVSGAEPCRARATISLAIIRNSGGQEFRSSRG